MKQHNRTPLVLFLLLAAGAAVFVLCGIRLEWFVTWETVTPPTCTEDGYTLHHSYFNREKQVKPIEALGHHYLTEITAPTGTADAKRLMALMRLAAKQGMELTVTIEGADEEQAAAELQAFLTANL